MIVLALANAVGWSSIGSIDGAPAAPGKKLPGHSCKWQGGSVPQRGAALLSMSLYYIFIYVGDTSYTGKSYWDSS